MLHRLALREGSEVTQTLNPLITQHCRLPLLCTETRSLLASLLTSLLTVMLSQELDPYGATAGVWRQVSER